jgi:hypothetical protein
VLLLLLPLLVVMLLMVVERLLLLLAHFLDVCDMLRDWFDRCNFGPPVA